MTRTRLEKSLSAADHPILLETTAQLSEAKKSWQDNDVLGIDTEFVRERTYRAELGLVQVSDGSTAWLVDTVKLDSLELLEQLLGHPAITKILHSGSEDLEVLAHTVGTVPSPLVDTQIACAFLGQPLQMGYHATVQWLFDVEVDKDQTRSNWCRRPLTERQRRYAAMDVVLLPQMLSILMPRLEEKGRDAWMAEEIERARSNALREVEPAQAYLRVSGAGRLDQEARRVLRKLAAWRETTAQEKNLARGFVLPDAALLDLAKRRPGDRNAVLALESIHPKVRNRHANTFVELIQSGVAETEPAPIPEPLNNAQRRQLGAMRDLVKKKAEALEMEPALIASRRELENLLRSVMDGKPLPERFSGWRKAVATDELLALIT